MRQVKFWVTNKEKHDLVREKNGLTWKEYIKRLVEKNKFNGAKQNGK